MSLRASIATNYVLSITGTAVFIAGSMVVNRILTPTEIGIFAISQAVAALLMSIQQLGINHYIVREQTMSPEKLGSSALLLGAQGMFVCLVLLAIAPLAADFQDIPTLRPIIQVLALSMLAWPVEMFGLAVLMRELRFATIAVGSLLRTSISAGVGVVAVLHGFGPIGLAYAVLAGTGATAAFLLVMAWPHFRLRWTFSQWRAPFRFGIVTLALALVRMASMRGLDFLLGKLLGAGAVGYFSRGTAVVEMAQNQLFLPLTRVFLPTISKAKRESQGSYIWAVLRCNRVLLGLYHPFFALLAVFAGPVVAVLFGPQWEASVPLLSLLCVSQMIISASSGFHEVAVIEDRRRGLLMVDCARVVILLGSLMFVYQFGLIFVALLKVADSLIAAVFYIAFLKRLTGIPVRAVLRNNLHSTAVALGSCAPGLVYMHLSGWPYGVPLVDLCLLGLASIAAWLASLWLTRHDLWGEVTRAVALAVGRLGIGAAR